jgi:D-3-phosphoglycerate dehydrogenase / 2-oxoglutarate reductase
MAKFKIRTYNTIAPIGLNRFGSNYIVSANQEQPDAIMLRSFNLHDESVADSVLGVGRAGAGVNNIPVEKMTERGIVVFNAPGANANSVKELVLAGLLLAARNLPAALVYTKGLPVEGIKEAVESGKKKYVGVELSGKTLGVIGLGAIGHRVASTALDLGMRVVGYDPSLSPQSPYQPSSEVEIVDELELLVEQSDFVTIHVPLLPATKGLLSAHLLSRMKPNAVLLNFSRDELVDEPALVAALDRSELGGYVTDFLNEVTHGHEKIIALPHLGASTAEAEDNCAVMVADQLQDYLENGNVANSVNFPAVSLPTNEHLRLCVVYTVAPNFEDSIIKVLAAADITVIDHVSGERGELAYSLMNLDVDKLPDGVSKQLGDIAEVIRLRTISKSDSS